MLTARALAWRALRRWRTSSEFAEVILQRSFQESVLAVADRAFAQELFYGVIRNLTLLDSWIAMLRRSAIDHDTRDLLRIGLYQLFVLRTPEHAGVFETVELASEKNRGLLNALLRAALRRRPELEQWTATAPLQIRTSQPAFLLERWTRHYGTEATAALCHWNNKPPAIYARVNRARIGVDAFLAKHHGTRRVAADSFFVHCATLPVEAIRGGECYMADPSTGLAVELLAPAAGEKILDACAAPGGKTMQLAERTQNKAEIVAVDRMAERLALLRENLERLGASSVAVREHDWEKEASGFSAPVFDKILLDVPCSNTGVMRRRIDVRWRLQPDDFVRLPRRQRAMFGAVAPLLKPGGALVYSTCSLERDENEAVVEEISKDSPRLRLDEAKSVLPFRDGFDGAFAARFVAR